MTTINGKLIAENSSDAARRRSLCAGLARKLGGRYSLALGIDLVSMRSDEVFKWFLASLLFGGRISEDAAMKTYNQFKEANVLAPEAILRTGRDGLVGILDRGGYARYDLKTATKLLEAASTLTAKYSGDLNRLHFFAEDGRDLEKKLRGLAKGIGPATVGIFLRELRNVWEKAEPPLSEFALFASRMLGLTLTTDSTLALEEMEDLWEESKLEAIFADFEAALVKLGKNFCLKNRCKTCIMRTDCQSSNWQKGGSNRGDRRAMKISNCQ